MKRSTFIKAWLTHLFVVLLVAIPGWVLIRSLQRTQLPEAAGPSVQSFLWWVFGAVGVATLLAWWLAKDIKRPIRELLRLVQNLKQGHTQARLLWHREDEFQPLVQSFNDLAAEVHRRTSLLEERARWFESLVSSMTEGIAVIRQDGRILFANPAFQQMLQVDAWEGRPYWEVIRVPGFEEIMTAAHEDENGVQREIRVGDRVYQCWARRIRNANEVVVAFHDVTAIRETQRMKRDFVANVSHELRTPLTAIKGFLETLAEEQGTLNPRYLDIIQRHTDRLIHIVEDLLTLSRLEDPRQSLEFEPLHLPEIVADIVEGVRPRFEEKGLALQLHVHEKIPAILGDRVQIEQLLLNLLDNALRYTEQGKVDVILRAEDSFVVLEVADTGIGIPKEHLPRIFERFYVVDKARSRRTGGTGLGLSIVKHIVLLHRGRIEVQSTVGKGSRFIVRFPSVPSQRS